MIPEPFRLEFVARGLIERMDGARRSFATRQQLEEGLRRVAADQVDSVILSWREIPFAPAGPAQGAFVRREVLDTVLPRFVDAAWAMNEAERTGFGMGKWATPAGRVGLVGLSLVVAWFGLLRLEALPVMWPITAIDLAVPFLPDILAALSRRRYEADLRAILVDMARIQDHAQPAVPGEALAADAAAQRQPESEADLRSRAQSAARRADVREPR